MKKDTQYWDTFYTKKFDTQNSSFAEFIMPRIDKQTMVDFGCGNGRDLYYFVKRGAQAFGVDESFQADRIVNVDVETYMKKNKSPKHVYARFFWHSIPRNTQLAILKWTKHHIYIEARTTDDEKRKKVFPKHQRNYVDVAQLVKDLKTEGFQIQYMEEGIDLSPYKGENPHLVRIIACKGLLK